MNKPDKKKQLTQWLVFGVIAGYIGNRMGWLYATSAGNPMEKLTAALDVTSSILQRPLFLSMIPAALIGTLVGAAGVWLCYVYFVLGAHRLMPGKEHGSAEWGDAEDIAPLQDKEPMNNILLTDTEGLSLNGRMAVTKDNDYNRNKNILVVGGSGSGKTRYFVKPNLLQMNRNYIITDPKGSLLKECGYALASNGYKIKVLDLVHMEQSDHYNPFAYMHTEDDILKTAKNIITNLKANPRQSSSSDPIWEEGMMGLLEAIIAYVLFELRPEEQNMNSVLEIFRLTQVKENVPDYVSPLDILFEKLKKEKPDAFAIKQYSIYKMAAPKTAESINVSLGLRLASFNIPSVQKLMATDTLGLEDFAKDEKVALFIITPDTTKAYNFIAAVLYQQLFDVLIRAADNSPGNRLPRHCQLIMDEFANIGQIPDFEIILATIRSREISAVVIIQSIGQLKSQYKDDWATIVDNCDSLLFLGGSKTMDNLDFFSKLLGKKTIEVMNTSESHGAQGSFSKSYQSLGRDLMTPAEIQCMPRRFCLLFITGLPPFNSRKYDLERHPNYGLLSDADPANSFDINRRDTFAAVNFLSDVSDCRELNNI